MVLTRSQIRASAGALQGLLPSKPAKKRCATSSDMEQSAKRNRVLEEPELMSPEVPERQEELVTSPEVEQPLAEEPMSPEVFERSESPLIDVVGYDEEEEEDDEYEIVPLGDFEAEFQILEYVDEPVEQESYIVICEEVVDAYEVVGVVEEVKNHVDQLEKPEEACVVQEDDDEELREYLAGFEEESESEEESDSEYDESDSEDDEVRPIGALRDVQCYFWNKSVTETKLMKEYYRLRAGENLTRTLCRLISLDAPYSLYRMYHIDYHAEKFVRNKKWRPLVEELLEKMRRIKPRACRNLKKELLEQQQKMADN